METRGPSPLVPFLMLNIFAIIIFSPMVENLMLIPFLLMLLIYFIFALFPFRDSSLGSYQHGDVAATQEGESGYGFGTFLLLDNICYEFKDTLLN
ncbi:hypothetical protein CTI12_AA479770 [Artemisia annua]|uniref:Uncharacterized protein n=1 Tax=Artemisia annua TaxID=35608 RepID=A0A2U1LKX0_ARTAN|nr:hypothetical protein CTI12_AA479770 [Artemisia annua]